jgi:GT2 family glycosyltransferase
LTTGACGASQHLGFATVPGEHLCVSVVVSNLNGARYLPRLLDTLAAQIGVETEVIVVDRDSTDESGEILRRHPGVRVIQEPPESGLVAGYSVGAKEAGHPLLFFCNEDLYLDERCLGELATRIDLKNRVAACDPWEWTYDGKQWIRGGICYRRSAWNICSPFPFRMHECTVSLPDGSPIPFGCAGAVMVHADVYDELGGWDTSFFLDYEDIDFFIRAWQHDWICVTVPEARVFHRVGASNEQIVGARQQTVSRRRYVSNRASTAIVAFKYFSLPFSVLGALNWMATLLVHAVLVRRRAVWLDLAVVGEVARRLPAVVTFRRQNRFWNRAKPGERFFLDPQFSFDKWRLS